MSEYVRDLIQYVGISDNIPQSSSVFKQINVEDTFCLPIAKPDIEQIVKVISQLKVKSTKIIKTPKGVSLEGQALTGWKIVIEGIVIQKIQYVANECTQTVHAGTIITNHNYSGEPFIIDSAFAAEETPFITAWQAANPNVKVHIATAPFSADIAATMQRAPRVAVEAANAGIVLT